MKLPRFSKNAINTRRTQRGDFLIESLIGVLLIGIVGVGIARTASKVTAAQTMTQQQAQVITNLEGIASRGVKTELCNPSVAYATVETSNICSNIDGALELVTTDVTFTVDGIGSKSFISRRPLALAATIAIGDENVSVKVGQ